MTATVHHLPVTADTAILTCAARAAREGTTPLQLAHRLGEEARERAATAWVMRALCEGSPDIGDAAAHQRAADAFSAQAAAYAAAAHHYAQNGATHG